MKVSNEVISGEENSPAALSGSPEVGYSGRRNEGPFC